MPNFATVTLVGHLGRDPETKTVGSDTVTSFSIATNRKRKDSDLSTWWNCSMWGKRGEVIRQYLKKGDPILVVGEPCLRPYTTKDGREGHALEVDVRDWTFVGGKDGAQTSQTAPQRPASTPLPPNAPTPQNAAQAPANGYRTDYDTDIPF